MTVVCQHCHAALVWNEQEGYVHPGGGIYVVKCKKCSWRSDKAEDQQRAECPVCGGQMIWDDHVAMPVNEEAV